MLSICVVLHLSRPVEETGNCSAQSFPVKWPTNASRMCAFNFWMITIMAPSSFCQMLNVVYVICSRVKVPPLSDN